MTLRRTTLVPLAIGQAWLGLSTAYLLALLGLGARRPAAPSVPAGAPLSAVVVVPAHDEQDGIAATVAALRAQDHAGPSEVLVVADNCTDATAERASAAGATVWERTDPLARGKGQALAWAFARLWVERPDTGFVAVVDADCLATPNLLSALDRALRAGAPAAQCAYDVGNADASSAAALRWAGFALMHRVRPRGRAALGLSADLFGTGMAFRAGLLRELPWTSFSVTEDAEYHVRLVQAGRRVAYVEDAAVVSPMPTSGAGAREQQLRWESGNAALARRTSGQMLLAGLRRRDPHLLHAGAEQLVPPQALLCAGAAAGLAAGGALRRPALVASAGAIGAGQAAYVLGGLAAARAPAAVWRALPAAPLLVARKLAVLARIGSGRGATAWVRTERSPVPAGDRSREAVAA